MSKTLTLEGDVNAVDTAVRLTGQGSVAAPSLVVPKGVSLIKHIIVALGTDHAADGQVVGFLRIGGNAVKNGESTLMFAGTGGTSNAAPIDQTPGAMNARVFRDVDIEVQESDTISVSGEMAGADVGDCTYVVTLIFGS